MKDAYSFDVDRDALMKSYQAMYDAYARIFTRLGLTFRAVEADTGAIGGFASHEFQVLADSGEDAIAWCTGVAITRRTSSRPKRSRPPQRARRAAEAMAKVPTPSQSTCEEVTAAPGAAARAQREVPDGPRAATSVQMLLVRGDHMGNEVKIGKLPGIDGWRWATRRGDRRGDRLRARLPRPGRPARRRAADRRSQRRRDERLRLRRERDGLPPARRQLRPRLRASPISSPTSATSSTATRRPTARARSRSCAASRSATCSRSARAIRATWARPTSTRTGKSHPIEMGCYGIGVTRVVAAAIEQNHDERGHHLAGADGAVHRRDRRRSATTATRRSAPPPTGCTTSSTAAGIEVLLDDRGERPGVMFADLELIGIPHRVTIGDRGLKDGNVEYQGAARRRRRRRCRSSESCRSSREKLA